ncbi:MAG: ROK family protein, partial [Acidobacteriota bacterium]
GCSGDSLPPDHAAWDLEAAYLGDLAANLTLTLSPQRLIFGGGVLAAPGLLAKIRQQLIERLAGYVRSPALDDASGYLVAPGLDDRAGVLGAIALARRAAADA